MSVWVFQDPSLNNYVTYIDTSLPGKYGVIKSNQLNTHVEWSYSQITTDVSMGYIVGTADSTGISYISYQYRDVLGRMRIAVYAISADGNGPPLWSASYLSTLQNGNFTNPTLSVVGSVLILGCMGATNTAVQILRLDKTTGAEIWVRQLTNTATLNPAVTISPTDSSVYVSYMTDATSSVLTRLTPDQGVPQWSRSFPEYQGPPVPCFLAGTPILMADGSWKPIETLQVGDRLWTERGPRSLSELVVTVTKPSNETYPYFFPKGLLGAHTAFGISPNHKIYLKNGISVLPKQLGLVQIPMSNTWTYYNVRLEGWEKIKAAGVLVESCFPMKRMLVSGDIFRELCQKKQQFTEKNALYALFTYFMRGDNIDIPVYSSNIHI